MKNNYTLKNLHFFTPNAKFLATFWLFLCQNLGGYAQNNIDFNFKPLSGHSYTYGRLNEYKLFLDDISKKNTETLDKKIRKDYKEIITEKNTDLINELSENNFLFDDKISPYLTSLFYSIIQKNNLDKNLFHFFVSRSSTVNAYSFEDGTIVCNLGLLNIVETESQIAMVFCHEIGHCLLSHSNKFILAQLEKFNSREFLSQIKAIKREKYKTKSKLEELLMLDVFNRRKHKRNQEISADSLGMVLFIKTGYNTSFIPKLYDLLEASQNDSTLCSVQTFFRKEGITIDENWFRADKKMTFGIPIEKEIADSLKTHPDCLKRKLYAEAFFITHSVNGYDFKVGSKETLLAIKQNSLFEQAILSKDKKNISLYFFQLIQNTVEFPHNRYISTEILKTLLLLTKNQKNHSLYTIVDKPYNTQDDKDEYAKLLKFLDNIDLKQLADITMAYYQKNKDLITTNTETISNLNNLKQL